MSQVFLVPARHTDTPDVTARKLDALWDAAGLASAFRPGDLAAVKLHVGEPGTKTFTPPVVAASLVRLIRLTGAHPFLTDTAVLYRSPRDNGVTHAHVAHDHGFTMDAVHAPFIPADGVTGSEEVELEVMGKHFQKVAMAGGILHANSMLCLTHATGHLGTGYGGALKNLGMGCASRKGKLRQHHGHHPHVNAATCTACGTCTSWCPTGAITVATQAVIDVAKCIGCGECIASCRDGAVEFGWGINGQELQERIVEHAAAVIRSKGERMVHVMVMQQVTKDCDCLGLDQRPLLDDVGFLASRDAVALDQAVLDIVMERCQRTLESMSYPRRDGTAQLRYAEEMGLGSTRVELVTVDG
jgi:hypothetical protein